MLFQTSRLQLLRPTYNDIPHFISIYCSEEMMAFLGSPFSEEQASSRIDTWNRQWDELGWGGGVIVNKVTKAFIGTAKLIFTELPDYKGSCEIGYMVLPQYQGNGFASEIAVGMVEFLFQYVSAKQIVANVHPNNQSSNRVLEKLGFLDQGLKNYKQSEFIGYEQQRIWLLTYKKYEDYFRSNF